MRAKAEAEGARRELTEQRTKAAADLAESSRVVEETKRLVGRAEQEAKVHLAKELGARDAVRAHELAEARAAFEVAAGEMRRELASREEALAEARAATAAALAAGQREAAVEVEKLVAERALAEQMTAEAWDRQRTDLERRHEASLAQARHDASKQIKETEALAEERARDRASNWPVLKGRTVSSSLTFANAGDRDAGARRVT